MNMGETDASGPPVSNESTSFWLKNGKYQNIQTQPFPKSVDIAIIGAGISGVSVAYHLIQYYTDNSDQLPEILLLDSRGVCGGATGRNGGAMVIGKNKERITKEFEHKTFNDMLTIIKQYNMENYIQLENKKNQFTFCAARIVFSLIDVMMDKYKNKLLLLTQTTVNNVHCNDCNNMYQMETDHNGIVRIINTKIVVYATNGYTSYLLPEYKDKIFPVKNQVIMTKPIKVADSTLRKYIFGNDYDYYYQRKDNRILIGGGRNSGFCKNKWLFDYDESVNKIDENITKYLINTYIKEYSKNIEIENIWQGILGFTNDNLPYVGALPNRKNCYICAGFNGHGMTFAFNCAKAVAQMIAGKSNSDTILQEFTPKYRLKKKSKL